MLVTDRSFDVQGPTTADNSILAEIALQGL